MLMGAKMRRRGIVPFLSAPWAARAIKNDAGHSLSDRGFIFPGTMVNRIGVGGKGRKQNEEPVGWILTQEAKENH